jgi:hypothetical protein
MTNAKFKRCKRNGLKPTSSEYKKTVWQNGFNFENMIIEISMLLTLQSKH